MLQLRGYNAFKCFRNSRQFGDSSIVLNINLRTLFVKWNNKRIFPDSRKNRWWDDKWKSLRMGLLIVRAENFRTHPGSPSGSGE